MEKQKHSHQYRLKILALQRISAAFSTLPTIKGWADVGACTASMGLFCLWYGTSTDFLELDIVFLTPPSVAGDPCITAPHGADIIHAGREAAHANVRMPNVGGSSRPTLPETHRGADNRTLYIRGTSAAVGAAAVFVSPSLLEEAVFRAALLPHPGVEPHHFGGNSGGGSGSKVAAALMNLRWYLPALAIFVAYHLVNPRARSRAVFSDTRFLMLAAAVGAGCTVAYIVTGGSLLAATIVHWVAVVTWLFALGGCRKLGYLPPIHQSRRE